MAPLAPQHIGKPPTEPGPLENYCVGKAGLYQDRDCNFGGNWLLPEVPYCARHMPYEYLPVVIRRRNAWITSATELWERIVKDHPVELRPEDIDRPEPEQPEEEP